MVNLLDIELQNELKMRYLLAKYSEDDVLVHAYMLKSLKDVYKKYGIEMPENIKNYIETSAKKLNVEIPAVIDKLKEKMNNYSNGEIDNSFRKEINSDPFRDEPLVLKVQKRKSLFPEGYFDKRK
jgi:hypothetical protein